MPQTVIETKTRARILCVDDEPDVLAGLRFVLRKHFDVEIATSAQEGLETIARSEPFDVVVSDMRMPGMNGAAFLKAVREQSAATTRILLTGQTDLESAISAVNEAQIYRFLSKPCPPEEMLKTLHDAVEVSQRQFRGVTEKAGLIAELDAAAQIGDEILSGVSHELRTPINSIVAAADLLKMSEPDGLSTGQAEFVDSIAKEAAALSGLVDAILQAQELKRGDGGILLTEASLPSLLNLMKSCASGLACPGAVALEWIAQTDEADRIKTDCGKVALAVRNLVSNALKFTEAGRVTVAVRPNATRLEVEVVDTGPGIAAEILPTIFEIFRQGDGSSTRTHRGLGLGLYISKTYVERLGGALTVESRIGEGSTFLISVPGYIRHE